MEGERISVTPLKSAVDRRNIPHLPLSLARASISSKKTMEGATALAFRNTCRPATTEKREADRTLDGDTYDSSWVQTRTGNTAAINAAGYVTVHPFMTSRTKNTNKRALAGKPQSCMTTTTHIHYQSHAFVLNMKLHQTLEGPGSLHELKNTGWERTSLTALSDSPTYLLSNSGP